MALENADEFFGGPEEGKSATAPAPPKPEPQPELIQWIKPAGPAAIELPVEQPMPFNEREQAILGDSKDNKFLQALKGIFKATVVEDIFPYQLGVDEKNVRCVYELRSKYNDGVNWRNHKRQTDPADKVQRGDEQILELQRLLAVVHLPLTEEQKLHGFPRDLLKPEHRTWDEFALEMTRRKQGIGARIDYLWQNQQSVV